MNAQYRSWFGLSGLLALGVTLVLTGCSDPITGPSGFEIEPPRHELVAPAVSQGGEGSSSLLREESARR